MEQSNVMLPAVKRDEDVLYGLDVLNGKSVVAKAKELVDICLSNFTLRASKIVDVYAARINPKDDSRLIVAFEKKELEELFGVKIKDEHLEKDLDSLLSTITVRDPENPKSYIKVNGLFDVAVNDDDAGLIKLKPSAFGTKYLFSLGADIKYFKFRLDRVKNLKGEYAYALTQYLLLNAYRGIWEVDLDTLKQALHCNANYDNRTFNRDVLKRASEEVLEKAGIVFEYKTVIYQRRVVGYTFSIIKGIPEQYK